MNWAGVDKAVLLQGPFYGDQNAVVLDAVTRFPDRFIGAAYFDPWDDNPGKKLGEILSAGKFRALKLECTEPTGLCGIHPDARLDDPRLAPLWDQLEASGLVLVVDLGTVGTRSYQTAAIRMIARAPFAIANCHSPPGPNHPNRGRGRQKLRPGKSRSTWACCRTSGSIAPRCRLIFPTRTTLIRAQRSSSCWRSSGLARKSCSGAPICRAWPER